MRNLPVFGYDDQEGHGEIEFEDVRVPATNVISKEGDGFMIAQARLGPGRIHHCMRAIGAAERALEAMCKRAVSRVTFGKPLATRGNVLDWIAESRIEIEMARLLTLKAAWMMDTVGNRHARTEIAAIKVAAPNVALKVLDRAIQVHGGGGVSDDFGLATAYAHLRTLRLADGPDEVHKLSIARRELGALHPPRGARRGAGLPVERRSTYRERPADGEPEGLLSSTMGAAQTSTTCWRSPTFSTRCAACTSSRRARRSQLAGSPGYHWYLVPRVGYPDPASFDAASPPARRAPRRAVAANRARRRADRPGWLLDGRRDELRARLRRRAARTRRGARVLRASSPVGRGLAAGPRAARGLRVFIAHGTRDQVICVDFARAAARAAARGGPAGRVPRVRRPGTTSTPGRSRRPALAERQLEQHTETGSA